VTLRPFGKACRTRISPGIGVLFVPNPATVKLGFFFGVEQPLGGVGYGTTGAVEHHRLSEVNIQWAAPLRCAQVLRDPRLDVPSLRAFGGKFPSWQRVRSPWRSGAARHSASGLS
jgi:hypothetical protein